MYKSIIHDLRSWVFQFGILALGYIILPIATILLMKTSVRLGEIVLNIYATGLLCFVLFVVYSLFKKVLSSIYGKLAYFYRCIPMSNTVLIISKMISVTLGVLILAGISILAFANYSGVVLWWSGGSYLRGFSGILGSIPLWTYLVSIAGLLAAVVSAFALAMLTTIKPMVRLSLAGASAVCIITWVLLVDLLAAGLVMSVPGIVPLSPDARQILWDRFTWSPLPPNSSLVLPVTAIAIIVTLLILVPLLIVFIGEKRGVNIRG